MGVVYLAEQLGLARRVALKVIAPEFADEPDFRRRFIREAHIAASIDHPSVIPVYDAGQVDEELYIAMRYVDGVDLHAALGAGPLEDDRMLPIMSQAAGALDAAHAEGLVHRDVKPANILLERSRAPEVAERVFLTDFGLTKRPGASTTETGVFIGTVDYAAPEQLRGQPLDGRTDVYALGCVLFECLTGRPPFRRATQAEVITSHLMDSPPSISLDRPDLPRVLDAVLARALAKTKESRHSTCSELVDETRAALDRNVGIARARPFTLPAPTVEATPAGEPVRVPLRRRWRAAGVAAMVVALVIGGGVAALLMSGTRRHIDAAPTPGVSSAPTPTPSGPSHSSSPVPSPSGAPSSGVDARSVPLSRLLRQGARALTAQYGDMDGDGIEEIALESESRFGPSYARPEFLDLFKYFDGAWQRIWAASEDSLPHDGGVAGVPALPTGIGVRDLHFVDPFGNGREDLLFTTGVVEGTDHSGEVWIASLSSTNKVSTAFYESVPGIGDVTIDGSTVLVDTDLYSKHDANCCPSEEEHQVVGDDGTGTIRVLSRHYDWLEPQLPESASYDLFLAWKAGDKIRALQFASPQAVDAMFQLHYTPTFREPNDLNCSQEGPGLKDFCFSQSTGFSMTVIGDGDGGYKVSQFYWLGE
jgi:serine/threonine protein kinase